jgi:restriction system protein
MDKLPKHHETYRPILEVLKNGEIMQFSELRKAVRDIYYADLPDDALSLTTKSGVPLIFDRIGWGKVYLKQAGLVKQPARAMVQITDKGLMALERGELSARDIENDPDFIEHRDSISQKDKDVLESTEDQTPQDMIDAGVQVIENQVKSDLLDRLIAADPFYFEQVVNGLFEKMGYGGARTTVKTGDGGIDGVINQDELGLEKIYIQAKRYNGHNVREPEIRNFIGAMSGDTQKGIFVTTSSFDAKAIKKAWDAHHTIILIDGEKLADLMYKYGVGVQARSVYTVKSVDEDFFV